MRSRRAFLVVMTSLAAVSLGCGALLFLVGTGLTLQPSSYGGHSSVVARVVDVVVGAWLFCFGGWCASVSFRVFMTGGEK